MEYLAAASASVPGLLPRLSSPSAEKHMCIVLGREAREGPNTQDQARRLMAETGTRQCGNVEPYFNQMWFTVFPVLMLIVRTSRSTHAERQHPPNDVEGAVPVRSLRVSSEDRRTPVRRHTVKQSAELRSALELFATAQSFRECSLLSVN